MAAAPPGASPGAMSARQGLRIDVPPPAFAPPQAPLAPAPAGMRPATSRDHSEDQVGVTPTSHVPPSPLGGSPARRSEDERSLLSSGEVQTSPHRRAHARASALATGGLRPRGAAPGPRAVAAASNAPSASAVPSARSNATADVYQQSFNNAAAALGYGSACGSIPLSNTNMSGSATGKGSSSSAPKKTLSTAARIMKLTHSDSDSDEEEGARGPLTPKKGAVGAPKLAGFSPPFGAGDDEDDF